MAKYTAIYDACVLYPAPLRDLLLQLAVSDLFRARWTKDIHEEWQRNVLKNRPEGKLADLQKTRELMDCNVRDCLICAARKRLRRHNGIVERNGHFTLRGGPVPVFYAPVATLNDLM